MQGDYTSIRNLGGSPDRWKNPRQILAYYTLIMRFEEIPF